MTSSIAQGSQATIRKRTGVFLSRITATDSQTSSREVLRLVLIDVATIVALLL